MSHTSKLLYLILLCCIVHFTSQAQSSTSGIPSYGGRPWSHVYQLEPHSSMYTVPSSTIEQALDDIPEDDPMPNRYGVLVPGMTDAIALGEFHHYPSGGFTWRLEISAANAQSLDLQMDFNEVPESGVYLYLYDADKNQLDGGYHIQEARRIPSFPMETEHLVIEISSGGEASELKMGIANIVYGFESIESTEDEECMIAINCKEGYDFKKEKRAVAKMTNSGGWCTANVLALDGGNAVHPNSDFLLTAAHCFTMPQGIDYNFDLSNTTYRFNNETRCCAVPTDGSFGYHENTTIIAGGDIVSGVAYMDYVLIKIDKLPDYYEAYHQGWDAGWTHSTDEIGVVIGHPANLMKQYVDGPIYGGSAGVGLHQTNGYLFKGTSGSGILNADKNIVSIASIINTATGGCPDQNRVLSGYTFSGMYNEKSDPKENLKAHLDPNNQGNKKVDGYPNCEPPTDYDLEKIRNRVVFGDFDNDGSDDDQAALHYDAGTTEMHIWRGTPSSREMNRDNSNWWTSAYNASKVSGRVVSGDFDNDGYRDDVAGMYSIGGGAQIHLWKGDGSSFTKTVDWLSSGYAATRATDRMVSGDFDNDGYVDDIAAFYDYGIVNGVAHTRIHVWLSNGSNFVYQGATGWWNPVGWYSAPQITNRVVSGDFDSDGKLDDIAAIYDLGNAGGTSHTVVHVWLSNGTTFAYQSAAGWWYSNDYSAASLSGRVVSGDFDGDNKYDDIAALNDRGDYTSTMHVWLGDYNSFDYQGDLGWWEEKLWAASQYTDLMTVVPYPGEKTSPASFMQYPCFDDQEDQARFLTWLSLKKDDGPRYFRLDGKVGWWLECSRDPVSDPPGFEDGVPFPTHIADRENNDLMVQMVSAGVYNVSLKNGNTIDHLKVIDLNGKIVYQRSEASTQALVDLNTFQQGMYLIEINETYQAKVIR